MVKKRSYFEISWDMCLFLTSSPRKEGNLGSRIGASVVQVPRAFNDWPLLHQLRHRSMKFRYFLRGPGAASARLHNSGRCDLLMHARDGPQTWSAWSCGCHQLFGLRNRGPDLATCCFQRLTWARGLNRRRSGGPKTAKVWGFAHHDPFYSAGLNSTRQPAPNEFHPRKHFPDLSRLPKKKKKKQCEDDNDDKSDGHTRTSATI